MKRIGLFLLSTLLSLNLYASDFSAISCTLDGNFVDIDWTWTGGATVFYVFSGSKLLRMTTGTQFYYRLWKDASGSNPTVGPGEYTFTVQAEPVSEGGTPDEISCGTFTLGKLSWSFNEAVRSSPYSSTHFAVYMRKLRSRGGTATSPVLIYTRTIPGAGSTDQVNFSTFFEETETDQRMFGAYLSAEVKTAVATWHGISEPAVNDAYVWAWITDPYANQFSVTTCQLDGNDDPIGESAHSNLGLSAYWKTTP
jgi:hypothetical protein